MRNYAADYSRSASIDVGRREHRLTPQWSGPLARIRSPRPLTVGVSRLQCTIASLKAARVT